MNPTNVRRVRAYVKNQEEHHRTKTFQEEYVQLLKRGMVKYDERYLWSTKVRIRCPVPEGRWNISHVRVT